MCGMVMVILVKNGRAGILFCSIEEIKTPPPPPQRTRPPDPLISALRVAVDAKGVFFFWFCLGGERRRRKWIGAGGFISSLYMTAQPPVFGEPRMTVQPPLFEFPRITMQPLEFVDPRMTVQPPVLEEPIWFDQEVKPPII